MTKITVLFLVGFIAFASFGASFGAEKVLTLEAAVAEVLSHNPDVQVARSRTDAAKARIPQAKSLEDPMVGVRFYNVPINTLNVREGMDIDTMVQQKVPFPGKRYLRGKAARLDADSIQEMSQGKIADVLLDLKQTYYMLYRLDRTLVVNREGQKIVRQFLGSEEARYATGKGSVEAPLKAQVELSKLENEAILLEQERITHMSHLKALLSRESHEEIEIPSEIRWPRLTIGLEEVRELAKEGRPELKTLDLMEKEKRSRLTAARQGLIPDLSLALEYVQRPQQQDAWTGTAMINLPIFFWQKNRGEIREAKALLKATEAEHRSMQVHTRHEIDRAYSAVRVASRLVASYRTGILPQAKANLEVAEIAYSTNKVDFRTLIDAARTYKDLQMSFYETEARLGISFAELERLVGRDL